MTGALKKPKASAGDGPDAAAIEAIVAGRHGDPFAILGPHRNADGFSIRVFAPEAEEVDAIDEMGRLLGSLEKIHHAGFFAGAIGCPVDTSYRLRFRSAGAEWEGGDPYRFMPVLGDIDLHLLAEGTHRRLYEKLGAHPTVHEGIEGVVFAVWAPNAQRVSVVGDFNGWDGRRHPMRKRHEAGIWELFIPVLKSGALYKFEILGRDGELLPLKSDPVALEQEVSPSTASRVHGLPRHDWGDDAWMQRRGAAQDRSAPISIYEVHLGSWRRGEHDSFLDYDTLADSLIPYITDLGFSHIELLPISEHPFSGSWGYQPLGLFSPTSRFGPPEAFARFVDRCHQKGIGVLIDWVPAHFPSDPHGLVRFDGTALYEHEDPRLGFHKDWNTLIYNFGRREVSNFLQANALFWLNRYHVDGLRVDAVASMLYLDYSREPGEWMPNIHGGRENLEAVRFLQGLNERVYGDVSGTITIAEESTAWPQVSRPVEHGGLGFGYKWNMGWMHDTLAYMSRDPVHRSHHHNQLTFGLIYAFSENFVLPLSHDEVVHGKGSLLGKMPGDRWQKFANLRAYLAFMWTHPGKKLLFMGGEFAQEREWNHDQSLDWHLFADPSHRGVHSLVRDLNGLYRSCPALHRFDCEPRGFQWIDAEDSGQSVLSYLRRGEVSDAPMVVVCNFTPVVRQGFHLGVPERGRWRERLNTDSAAYGGTNVGNLGSVEAQETSWHGQPFSLELTLPPLATVVLEHAGD
ncbi:MAG TPA: 1,4-alpha-glucan branching protein GlgB [Methyloceanibacter sp.]|nr:1,4-alpha-glucan branching protein GlgB [Methyloceanibacter sp.]